MTEFINGVAQVAAVSVGGLYGINVETLSADKTLVPGTDKIYQYLDEGGANRIITLDTASASAGDRFVIRHNGISGDTRYLHVKQSAISLDKIYAGAIKEFIFDGTNWISRGIGTGEDDAKKYNVSIGHSARGHTSGVGIGFEARGHSSGVAVGYKAWGYTNGVGIGYEAVGSTHGIAIGYRASGYTYGVGIGREAVGHTYGIAIGYKALTNAKRYSMALGYFSECERVGETSINIDVTSDQENNVVQGRWALETVNDTPAEMFCAGYGTSRFTIRASSALAFSIKVMARDNVAGHVAMYTFEGIIKRDASNNTVLSVINKAIIHEDDASWDVNVTADDTNESLKIEVTGDASNITQWAAVMDGVETHF